MSATDSTPRAVLVFSVALLRPVRILFEASVSSQPTLWARAKRFLSLTALGLIAEADGGCGVVAGMALVSAVTKDGNLLTLSALMPQG